MKKEINFPYLPQCLNCYQGCAPYGYFYNERNMDDSDGHSFICQNCWTKTPKWKRWWHNWQRFTSQIAEKVKNDWEIKENKF